MLTNNMHPSAYQMLIAVDSSIPIDEVAVDLWLRDINHRSRWFIRPLMQFFLVALLHVVRVFKRLLLLYLVGPWKLGQCFLTHGFFTEHLPEKLIEYRDSL